MVENKILPENISTDPSNLKDEDYGRFRLKNSPFHQLLRKSSELENASNQSTIDNDRQE